ncbi:unnamed protein product [Schistocephalus solidus]|uniref:Uncharacterized protein n=1 Tax=Schistocephalus solidus TaxID=70667 RepID=A0A183SL27_SCHSO|nr:unnamed protein product [Schistocephalus solidus]
MRKFLVYRAVHHHFNHHCPIPATTTTRMTMTMTITITSYTGENRLHALPPTKTTAATNTTSSPSSTDSIPTCPYSNRTFTARLGPAGPC